MLRLMKYLKKSIGWIVIILALLVVQAYCDLSLPSYTSDIVDVGIQQGGITEKIPKAIRKSQFDLLEQISKELYEKVIGNYTLVQKDVSSEEEYKKYVKEYSVLSTEPIYVRKDLSKKEQEALEPDMTQAMLIIGMYSGSISLEDMGMGENTEDKTIQKTDPSVSGEETQGEQVIPDGMENSQNPADMLQMLQAMPEMITDQIATAMLKAEYEVLGINTGKIQINYIIKAGIKMLALALLSMVVAIFVGLFASKVGSGFSRDVRDQVFKKVVHFSTSEFDKFSTASLITRSTNDIQQVQMLVIMMLRLLLYAPILGIGGIFKVLKTNASMTWIIALAVALIVGLVFVLFSIAMPKFKIMQKLVDRLNLVTREILTGLPVIRAFSTEEYEEKRFDKANKDLTRTSLFVNRVMTFMMPLMMLIMNVIMVMILWFGAKGIDAGQMQVGDMMAFMQYAMQIIMSFLMLCMMSIMLPRAAVAGNRVAEVLNTEIIIKDAPQTQQFERNKKGYVEFDHVFFKYPGAEECVLKDITFTAKPGETTAIIGSTGSGKSTLVHLIPRLYDISEGHLYVDGIEVSKAPIHELRDKIGFVPQKGVLFTGTIDSNIRYGRQNATKEEVERAALIAQAKNFIEAKEDQYEELIAQGGSNVSGGQKQRLSIARAIAKNPEIYIFDDSFSALDYKTDSTLRKCLKEETKNAAVIIVAQRISTILHAEQILVLDEGEIVGKGTHQELMENCEVYRQIASSQLSEAELASQRKDGVAHE